MFNKELLEILACPSCQGDLTHKEENLICEKDKLSFPIKDGIPMLLIEEAKKLD